jgi:acetoacetyl-CoA synthetase
VIASVRFLPLPSYYTHRRTQIKPKVLLSADKYRYNGKTHDITSKLSEVVAELRKTGLTKVILVGQLTTSRQPDPSSLSSGDDFDNVDYLSWGSFLSLGGDAPSEIAFARLPGTTPVHVLYSSGTTGKPKCIVHHAVGMILSSKMTGALHNNFDHTDVYFQFTTLGWVGILSFYHYLYCFSTSADLVDGPR